MRQLSPDEQTGLLPQYKQVAASIRADRRDTFASCLASEMAEPAVIKFAFTDYKCDPEKQYRIAQCTHCTNKTVISDSIKSPTEPPWARKYFNFLCSLNAIGCSLSVQITLSLNCCVHKTFDHLFLKVWLSSSFICNIQPLL